MGTRNANLGGSVWCLIEDGLFCCHFINEKGLVLGKVSEFDEVD